MVESACTINGTALDRVGRSGDFIAVELEVGDKGHGFSDDEAVRGFVGDGLSVLGPVDEGIAFVGCGGQRACCKVVVSASTINVAAFGRVSRSGDFIAVELEVGNEGSSFGDGEAVFDFCGDDLIVFGPVKEGVTFVGRGSQHACIEMVVSASTINGAALCRISRSGDFVTVELEVGYKSSSFSNGKGIFGFSGNHFAIFGPTDKSIAFVFRGG